MLESDNLRLYALTSLTLTILGVGTAFYHFVENLSWLDALYFSTVNLTTVGYGDFSPVTSLGKMFTIVYILIGVGILVAFLTVLAERVVYRQMQK